MQDIVKSIKASVKLRNPCQVKEAISRVKRELMYADEDYWLGIEILYLIVEMKNPLETLYSLWGLVVDEIDRSVRQ
ncbi:hypothetical protein [Hutsoniella sourekii]|uniref:hypothetical protein n=1 Tax=Hutsoniella sourekii TaxID=87650 RepID=UPI000486E113|nr:hypothetical protein [Hutsoniella sourekii]